MSGQPEPSVLGDLMGLFLILLGVLGMAAFVALGAALLFRYGLAMIAVLLRRQGPADEVVAPEPAFKQYFFKKAWLDYRSIVDRSSKASWDMLEWAVKLNYLTEKGCFVVGQMILIGAAAGIVTGAAMLALIGLCHLALVVLCCAVAISFAYLCRVLEYGAMLWRRIFLVCPHAGCYRRIALPIYVCPSCGVQHKQLIPGSYGTLRRRCQCGLLLPTMFLVGRHRLPSLCPHPHCLRPLSSATGTARNLHFPIVGGPTTGKSSLLTAIMAELSEAARSGRVQLAFPEKKDERLFAASREAFASGQLVAKTAEYSPTAFLAAITDGRGKRALVYSYDAAGELYQGMDELHGQQYYAYLHGILLVVDPYSLPQARDEASGDRAAAARPSAEQPEAVYERMVDTLRGFSGQTGHLPHPLAVVLTKVDVLGGPAKLQAEGGGQKGGEAATSESVKTWLERHGAGNLVRTIHKDFADVKYFACSALGRLPDGTQQPFVPIAVLAPFAWLLGHYGLRIPADATRAASTARVATRGTTGAADAAPSP